MPGVTVSAHTSQEIVDRIDLITYGTLTRTPKPNAAIVRVAYRR